MPCGTKKRTKQPSSRVKAVRVPIQTKSRSFVAYNNDDYYPNLGRELHPYEIPVYISSISGYEIPDKYQQAQYHLIHAHYPKFSEKKTPKIFSYTGIPHNKLERVLPLMIWAETLLCSQLHGSSVPRQLSRMLGP